MRACTLQNKIKVFRAMSDITQEKLADTIDLSRSRMNEIENGGLPGLVTAMQIADELKTTVNELFTIKYM